ncbi:S-layer homology domain-containing protein [uncultured Flavonifractor sp.]|uniref:S-layer homology domain-containing protein n=1 Tax=uncultured Flavonifractor sp. TaxID=1193534 RepID=UPI0025E9FCBF|nr:S-layer homology domain-containing protein [uncultured Flavonifractor sp.]
MKRRVLSILLSLCLVLSLLPTAAFAQGKSYVALGDSITTGYGLTDEENDSFAALVANENGYELTNLAEDGTTSGDLLEVVQDEENSDILQNADLITITIGGNDLMGALYQYLADAYNAANGTDISANDVQDALAGTSSEINQATMLTFATDVIGDFADSDAAKTALEEFGENLSGAIAAIRTANLNVTIIMANQYNPYTHAFSGLYPQIVEAFDEGLALLNGAIDAGAKTGVYSVADVYTVFQDAAQNPCNASLLPPSLDFHPNAYGHELIAEVINSLLAEIGGSGGEEQPEPQVEQLWVNGKNILEATDYTVQCGSGKAVYDPADNTLTLDNATITEAHYNDGNIEFTGDLIIVLKGENTITSASYCGIGADYGSLTIRGEDSSAALTIEGCTFGIDLWGGDLTISSSTLCITGTFGGIHTYSDISISGSNVTACSINGHSGGISTAGSLTIDSTSTVTAVSENKASFGVSATEGIIINGNIYSCSGPKMVVESGEPKEGLRTFGVVVNGVDVLTAADYTVSCGGGKAVYAPEDNTLTLNNAEISSGYAYYGNTCGIYSDEDLTIVLEGTNTISGANYGIRSEEGLTIRGDGSLTITGDYVGIYTSSGDFRFEGGTLDIEIDSSGNDDVDGRGIISDASDDYEMTISGGSITIDMEGDGFGIFREYGDLKIEGGCVEITSTDSAIYAGSGDVIISGTPTITVTAGEGNLGIQASDRNIKLNDTVYTCDMSTVTIQSGSIITGLRQKGVVVNDVLLSDSGTVECGEGTAFYNADNKTLTLTNATINTGYSYFDGTCGIYADVPLTIILVGENTISGMDYGIYGGGNITIEGNGTIVVSAEEAGIFTRDSLSLNSGTVTATGLGDGSFGIYAGEFTMEEGSALIASGGQAAIIAFYSCSLPDGYLPDGYSLQSDDYDTVFTIAKDGSQVIYNYDPTAGTFTLTGAATRVTLTAPAVVDDGKDDDHDTGSTTESERNPDGSLTTTVTKPDGSTVETTRNPDGSKEVVETKKDGTVITTTTDKSGNETKTTENPDGTSVVAITRTDGSTSATTVDEDGLSVTVAALSDSAIAQGQTGTVSLPMPSVTAASDLDSAPAVMLDLPADTAVKVEIPVENVTAGTVAVLEKADGTSEIVKTSVTTTNGVVLTLSAGETVKIVDNTKTFADVADTFWGADAVAFASSRELFNGTSATDFSPNAPMNRAMIVTVLARLDGVDTTAGSTWYEAGVQWAVSSGISDGSGLDQNLTREQLATMLYRYAQYKGYDVSVGENTNILSYSDVSSVSEYAMEAMQWACGAGIIGGKDGMLDPAGNATRAEVATMLMRFVALL